MLRDRVPLSLRREATFSRRPRNPGLRACWPARLRILPSLGRRTWPGPRQQARIIVSAPPRKLVALSRRSLMLIAGNSVPQGVHFVTIPLAMNYQRVFFMPPRRHGIASISVNNQRLEPQVSGRQPYDPSLLSRSVGHAYVLRPKDGENTKPGAPTSPEARIARPAEISLPAVVTVELDPEASAGTCNLLFSQGLHDKLISAEVKNASSDWRATSNIFVRGELLSVALDPDGCTSVRVHVKKHPSFSNWTSDLAWHVRLLA